MRKTIAETLKFSRENAYWLEVSSDIAFLILDKMLKDKISKKELSKILGFSVRKITRIVSGNANLTLSEILIIQKYLKKDLIKLPII